MVKQIISLILLNILFSSCESEQTKNERLKQEALEKRENEIIEKYKNNSLSTGSTPYFVYYGGNPVCLFPECSEITVNTSNSDVLVTIKSNNRVVRHGYIKSGDGFTFSLPNGNYQVFFYYGRGWNPEKFLKNGEIKGGFVLEESFGKDEPQMLFNKSLTYDLVLQQNGNFQTKPSDPAEAL